MSIVLFWTCAEEGMMNEPKESRPRVLLVNRCFVKRDNDGKLLIIKRVDEVGYEPGKWEIPGGKLDPGQDITYAQEREVMEETGLAVLPINRLAFVDSFIVGSGKYTGLPYVGTFSITKLESGKLRLSNEHTNYAWVTYDEMLEYDLTPQTRKAAIVLQKYLE